MAISLHEEIIPLRDAVKLVPRCNGKRLHIATLYRWTTSGCRGVTLEAIQVGAVRATSRQALERFFRRLTAAAGLAEQHSQDGDRADEYEAAAIRILEPPQKRNGTAR
jgi:hypothetical protein